jgi:hypothetical protein
MTRRFILTDRSVLKARQRNERLRLKAARQKYRYPNRSHHAKASAAGIHNQREFIMWDGEGPKDTGYSLFGNSKGLYIQGKGLGTEECLELIMDTEIQYPTAIHISFGFNYDVSCILKDVPRRLLSRLHTTKSTVWGEWELEHIPHKWFTVRRGQVSATIFDIHTFFAGGYVSSLQKFRVGTSAELAKLAQEKARRSEFLWAEIGDIKEYWRLELKLGPELGNAMRKALWDGGQFVPRSWHGPGAVARMALARNNVYKKMAICPANVRNAARFAFAGGRFEPLLSGYLRSSVYEYDINSAYPYYATMLPNLARGTWREGKEYEPGKFALYRIRYIAKPDSFRLWPLWKRDTDYSVSWTNRVESWYWAPEAELVVDDPNAEFLESLVFDEADPIDRPFAFLKEYYAIRKTADRAGNLLGYSYKVIINAIYGQLAQRAGWDRKENKAPRSHQLEWAGYITSACRAAVYKAARACPGQVISINTDSVQATCPIPDLDCGNSLGQWSEERYSEGIFWQSGIYFLREDLGYDPDLGYGWVKAKTRGIPKGSYTPEQLIEAVRTLKPLELVKHTFISYTLASMGQWDKLNTWADEPHIYELGGNGKRGHDPGRFCAKWCKGDVHYLSTMPAFPDDDIQSTRHYLPWLDGRSKLKSRMDDLMAWDVEAMDPEEAEWMAEYEL